MSEDAAILLTTVANAGDAETLARSLVEAHLAACVSLVPGVRSIYRWEGAIASDEECLLVIKTRASMVQKIEEAFSSIHPYQVPELIAARLDHVGNSYLAWLLAATDSNREVR